jgi:sulfofructosephosphate aldolase
VTTPTRDRLAPLARPSGGFAMVAIDQREALRAMFAEHASGPVADGQLTDFKVRATRELSPHASGVLVDRQFALDRVLAEGAVAPGCGLIVAADCLLPGPGELVASTRIDEEVDPGQVRARGGVALKLLVLWRPDEPAGPRVAMTERFLELCRNAGLISIIEPVSRPPRGGGAFDREEGVLAAARELGALGADLYKAEVPLHGSGPEAGIRRRCAELTEIIASPWVVLSSGVAAGDFPRAVRLACAEGASGFLAGRAVWRSVVGAPDTDGALRSDAVPRLQHLASLVDEAITAQRRPGG